MGVQGEASRRRAYPIVARMPTSLDMRGAGFRTSTVGGVVDPSPKPGRISNLSGRAGVCLGCGISYVSRRGRCQPESKTLSNFIFEWSHRSAFWVSSVVAACAWLRHMGMHARRCAAGMCSSFHPAGHAPCTAQRRQWTHLVPPSSPHTMPSGDWTEFTAVELDLARRWYVEHVGPTEIAVACLWVLL